VTVEVDGYDDRDLTFQMSPVVAGARHGRLTRIAPTTGQITTLAYRWLATDLAADTTGIGKWWAVSTITGPRGDVATVTTSATPVGDAYRSPRSSCRMPAASSTPTVRGRRSAALRWWA